MLGRRDGDERAAKASEFGRDGITFSQRSPPKENWIRLDFVENDKAGPSAWGGQEAARSRVLRRWSRV